jgi:hypothetical protein
MNKFILLSFSLFVFASFSILSFSPVQACPCQAQKNLGIDEVPTEKFAQTIIP